MQTLIMKTIKVLPYLEIYERKLVTTNLKTSNNVFLQQGSLDGACGPYCVFMALIMLGVTNYENATNLWNIKKSTKLGKLVKEMQNHDTLFNGGTFVEELEELLVKSYKNDLEVKGNNLKGKKLIEFTINAINSNKPVIVGVEGKDLAHWLLAVGYESENDKITKLFFLDPSEVETSNYWNSIINVKDAFFGYPYHWVSQEGTFVKFQDALSIGLK